MDRKKRVRGKMKGSNEKLKYSGREGKDKKNRTEDPTREEEKEETENE